MIEKRPILDVISHLLLLLGVAIVAFPVYVAFVASTQTAEQAAMAPLSLIPGDQLIENYRVAMVKGASGNVSVPPVARMMWISLVSALVIAIGKIAISMLSAFAIVYFRFPGRSLFFWMIFVTLMLPVEVRITPTYKVVSDLGMLNSYAGLTIPLIASATATFLFRQFFLTVPDELAEAARIDGAGPLRFFRDVLWPLSRANVIALFVIMFIYGWNQYLWPLLAATDQSMYPIGIGIKTLITGGDAAVEWNMVMAILILAMLPPGLVVVIMQKWFVKGLVDSEK
jgi:sn-glycerol 3-phosphate transport system permease protein